MRIQKLGLQIKAGVDFRIVNNESDRASRVLGSITRIMKRRGVTQEQAQRAMIGNPYGRGAIMVQRGKRMR